MDSSFRFLTHIEIFVWTGAFFYLWNWFLHIYTSTIDYLYFIHLLNSNTHYTWNGPIDQVFHKQLLDTLLIDYIRSILYISFKILYEVVLKNNRFLLVRLSALIYLHPFMHGTYIGVCVCVCVRVSLKEVKVYKGIKTSIVVIYLIILLFDRKWTLLMQRGSEIFLVQHWIPH